MYNENKFKEWLNKALEHKIDEFLEPCLEYWHGKDRMKLQSKVKRARDQVEFFIYKTFVQKICWTKNGRRIILATSLRLHRVPSWIVIQTPAGLRRIATSDRRRARRYGPAESVENTCLQIAQTPKESTAFYTASDHPHSSSRARAHFTLCANIKNTSFKLRYLERGIIPYYFMRHVEFFVILSVSWAHNLLDNNNQLDHFPVYIGDWVTRLGLFKYNNNRKYREFKKPMIS